MQPNSGFLHALMMQQFLWILHDWIKRHGRKKYIWRVEATGSVGHPFPSFKISSRSFYQAWPYVRYQNSHQKKNIMQKVIDTTTTTCRCLGQHLAPVACIHTENGQGFFDTQVDIFPRHPPSDLQKKKILFLGICLYLPICARISKKNQTVESGKMSTYK